MAATAGKILSILLACGSFLVLMPQPSPFCADKSAALGKQERLEIFNAYQRELYPPYNWAKPSDLPDLGNPPVLKQEESVDSWSGTVYFRGSAAWVVQSGSGKGKKYRLLVWRLGSKESRQVHEGPANIWGLAWSPAEARLLVGRGKTLLSLDPETLQIVATRPLPAKGNDMAVAGERLLVRRVGEIVLYDLKTLEKMVSVTIPKKSTQRMIAYDERRVLLSSTFWGNATYLFDFGQGTLEGPIRLSSGIHHGALLKSAIVEGCRLGIFDPFKRKVLGVAERRGNNWVCLSCGLETLAGGFGYRFSPVRQTLTGRLAVTADRDMPASHYLTSLYPVATYGQEITEERLAEGTLVRRDPLGNRYALFPVPALKKGEQFEGQVYSATMTRYTVKIDPLKSAAVFRVPEELKVYLQDDAVLDMYHPVVGEKLAQLTAGLASPAEKIVAIHKYATTIPYRSDKRYDPAPQVILNHHGSCNEHTRVQLALLRLAGIPARYAWNTLAGPGPRMLQIDHAIAEAWLPDLGWLPLEGLGGTAGSLRPYVIASINHAGPGDFKKRLKTDRPLFSKKDGQAHLVYELENQGAVPEDTPEPEIDQLQRAPEKPADAE